MLPALLPLAIATAAAPAPEQIEREKRTLIVFAPSQRDARLARQLALLDSDRGVLADRDVHVVKVVGDSVAGAYDYAGHLRARYGVANESFETVLLGRDGGVKLRTDDAVALPRLAATIDAMPMRQREMRVR
ncbi:DUF4174 domain-containing protein [Sphingomonas baiyangensis]|uniref:DUF4174 domain-containing protein n=1 Tax=Sphingomonas baiyangensis TaxID=2572576 RepID=A0A4U1L7B8_9SPHN|nr:DUF4174 domain-containing protein [Sphingomonas baiyangensis]TKD52847.1 DUF4174 domain-containing protein [Sphingomonas baiyangensis]